MVESVDPPSRAQDLPTTESYNETQEKIAKFRDTPAYDYLTKEEKAKLDDPNVSDDEKNQLMKTAEDRQTKAENPTEEPVPVNNSQ